MTRTTVLTLHGLKAAASDIIAGQSRGEDRYTLTASQYRSLMTAMAQKPSCTMTGALRKNGGDWIVPTFDDGLLSDYDIAFPALMTAGIKATFFITVENVGRPGYMHLQQIRELASCGMEIGSHGLQHRYLVTLPASEARSEILNSRDSLQQSLGMEIVSFSPVGGHYAPWMIEEARCAGYQAFASMVPGRTVIGRDAGITFFRRNHLQSHYDSTYIRALVAGESATLMWNILRYYALAIPKRILGMAAYDRLKHTIAKRGRLSA
jgi:peptidoglycan/xylan/chitin deacetylase (PgdA/CDA1 family)